MKIYTRHAISAIFPNIEGDCFKQLVEDIKVNGQRKPGLIYEGMILDGWQRFRACNEIGIKFDHIDFCGTKEEALKLVCSDNLHRRHLTDVQRAACAAEFQEMIKNKGRGRVSSGKAVGTNRENATSAIAGKAFNVSQSMVSRAIYVKKRRPAIFEKMKNGEITTTKAVIETQKSIYCLGDDVLPNAFSSLVEVAQFLKVITKKGWACTIICMDGRFEAKFNRSWANNQMAETTIPLAVNVGLLEHRKIMEKEMSEQPKERIA